MLVARSSSTTRMSCSRYPPAPGRPFGNQQHGFHGDHHARFQCRIDVFAKFQPGLPPIVVAEHAEGVAVSEGRNCRSPSSSKNLLISAQIPEHVAPGLMSERPSSCAETLARQILSVSASGSPRKSERSSAV